MASTAERLRVLRDLLGVTQEALAEQAGVTQSWISQVETSARDASEEGLLAIAAATGTPMSFFAIESENFPLDSLRFRKLSSARRSITRRVHAFFAESYRVSGRLVRTEGYPPPPLPYATKTDALSQEEIEELADSTRHALRLAPDQPIAHLTRALERSGIAVAPVNLPDTGDDPSEATGHFGVSHWGGVGEPALVGYFPGHSGDRDRFTLSHELGHVVLHTFRPMAQGAESEAHSFASAFLVPFARAVQEIRDTTTLRDFARLKATHGVSIQALIMRGVSIGAIGKSRQRSLFVQLTQRGWRKAEPVTVDSEAPLLLSTLLERQYGSGPRAYVKAAEDLAIHPAVLRSIAPTPNRRNADAGTRTAATVTPLRR